MDGWYPCFPRILDNFMKLLLFWCYLNILMDGTVVFVIFKLVVFKMDYLRNFAGNIKNLWLDCVYGIFFEFLFFSKMFFFNMKNNYLSCNFVGRQGICGPLIWADSVLSECPSRKRSTLATNDAITSIKVDKCRHSDRWTCLKERIS